jgi:putative membrane protein
MMFGWHDGWDWGMAAVNLVFWLMLVGAVVFGIVFYSRRPGPQAPDSGGGSSSRARAILEERFARGEISEQEFRERSDVLTR